MSEHLHEMVEAFGVGPTPIAICAGCKETWPCKRGLQARVAELERKLEEVREMLWTALWAEIEAVVDHLMKTGEEQEALAAAQRAAQRALQALLVVDQQAKP